MAVPPQLKNHDSEDAFNQDFVIPLLHRLGFSVVANFHGQSEFGKDLVFSEIDRFGHVRFNAIQTKYVPSISLNAVDELILDCKQAFSNDFRHPQTGSLERISSFYAVNGGSISDQAIQHFFSTLHPQYGGNVRILQGKDLLVLDRWSNSKSRDNSVALLTGLILEVKFNRRQLQTMEASMLNSIANEKKMRPMESIKPDATSAFLTAPPVSESELISKIELYWSLLHMLSEVLSQLRGRLGQFQLKYQTDMLTAFKVVRVQIDNTGDSIEAELDKLLLRLSQSQ